MNPINEKRYGKFTVSRELLNDLSADDLYMLFEKIIVVEASYHFGSYGIDYVAASPYFDPVHDGEKIPTYEPQMHKDKSGSKLEWKR
jgi:hypothetical protein